MGRDWIKKQIKEKYYKKAQAETFRSRAAFKIKHIESKFNVLSNAKSILDLCCAPGSWIEVIRKNFNEASVIGVDIVKMAPIEGVLFIQGDIRDDGLITQLEEFLNEEIDVIISDCAPKFTGSKETDIARQIFLIQRVLKISTRFLKKGGNFVCKAFDGNYMVNLRSHLKQKFENLHVFKPDASRKSSPELYLIGKLYNKEDLSFQFS